MLDREVYTYAVGFIAAILLSCFVVVISFAMCDYYCDKMRSDLMSRGTVIMVPKAVVETVP